MKNPHGVQDECRADFFHDVRIVFTMPIYTIRH